MGICYAAAALLPRPGGEIRRDEVKVRGGEQDEIGRSLREVRKKK